jgi:hypothetical protein
VAEGEHGVDFYGAAGGDEAGQQGYGGQSHRHDDVCEWVGWFYAVEALGDESRERECQGGAEDDANDAEFEAESADQFEDIARERTQRDPDADFVCARVYEVRHYAVDSDHGEKQCDSSKESEQVAIFAEVTERVSDRVFHVHRVENRNVGIHFGYALAQSRQRLRFECRTSVFEFQEDRLSGVHENGAARERRLLLQNGDEYLGESWLTRAKVFYVSNDANDLARMIFVD